MRTLASIQTISEIVAHPNADAIELAMVRGWQVIVKKGEFKAGDLAIYFEIDSFLPIREEFEFLRKSCFRSHPELGDGFRLKTIKLRGELSQGLLMPLSILNGFEIADQEQLRWGRQIWNAESNSWNSVIVPCEEGSDLTDLLEVQKWEAPIGSHLQGFARGNFPSFIRKTDQERVQNCWRQMSLLDNHEHGGINWVIEEKLDGSSCTMYVRFTNYDADGNLDPEVGVCSRNIDFKLDEENDGNTYIRTAKRDGYLDALPKLGLNIAIQAELCGPAIQGNKYKLERHELFVFDVWLIDLQRHASRLERKDILFQLMRLGVTVKQVPHLGTTRLPETLAKCLKMAEGKSKINFTAEREGIVFKSYDVIEGEVPSFKAISNKFLLKTGD